MFLKLCFLWSRYGTGTVSSQKSEGEPEPELVKSRKTGTIKNSYVSATLLGSTLFTFFYPESSRWTITCAAGHTWPTWLSSSLSSCSIQKVSSILRISIYLWLRTRTGFDNLDGDRFENWGGSGRIAYIHARSFNARKDEEIWFQHFWNFGWTRKTKVILCTLKSEPRILKCTIFQRKNS